MFKKNMFLLLTFYFRSVSLERNIPIVVTTWSFINSTEKGMYFSFLHSFFIFKNNVKPCYETVFI